MNDFSKSGPLEQLDLPPRYYNALRRNGISTIDQLYSLSDADFRSMRNLGEKSILKIKAAMENATHNCKNTESLQLEVVEPALVSFVDIEALNMSVRANNRLRSAGISNISDLIPLTKEELLRIHGMGTKTAYEILSARDDYLQRISEDVHYSQLPTSDEPFKQLQKNFYDKLSLELGPLSPKLLAEVAQSLQDAAENAGEESLTIESRKLWEKVYQSQELLMSLREKICQILEESPDGINEDILLSNISGLPFISEIYDSLIISLIENHKIIRAGDLLQFKFPTLLSYAKEATNQRNFDILVKRLSGATLDELGCEYSLQRERIRQITTKILKLHPRVWEDRYAKVFSTYNISEKNFCSAFKESQACYSYLNMIYGRGQCDIDELHDDARFPLWIRQIGERIRLRSYVELDGRLIHRDRDSLLNHLIQKYAVNDITYGEFKALYNTMLDNLDLSEDSKLTLAEHNFESKLALSHHLLWKRGQKFRYYDIDSYEYGDFLEQLRLIQYQNTEISTLKIFRDTPELMKEYDIRDEYELHNLLKKICTQVDYPDLVFSRMPTIQFGNINRDAQVSELLFNTAPIAREEFAALYEEEYGVKQQTVLANYVNHIACYLQDDVYRVDVEALSEEMLEILCKRLHSPFYLISDIVGIYKEIFPDDTQPRINRYTLNQLGFHVYTNYVISKQYNSAVEYFHEVLTSSDLVDLGQYTSELTTLPAFTAEMYKERECYEIVEFQPQRYISIRRLNENGVDKSDIGDYCDKVAEFVSDGTYFTIRSLQDEGFAHMLDSLGFGDWFYASLLAEDKSRFSYRRLGSTRLFRKGYLEVTITGLIEDILYSQDDLTIDIEDLRDILWEIYGIKESINKLAEIVRASSMYYDGITSKVYAEYDVYFDQI